MAIALTKLSETATKITLGWQPVPGAIGYRFQSKTTAPKWSHTFDATRSQVTFSKAEWYKVEALGVEAVGEYPAPTPVGDKFAAPNGSDSNPGTLAQPYRTLNKLQQSLAPGQTGALRAGDYGQTASVSPWHNLWGSGTAGSPITITNYPGEKATVKGYVSVDGSYVTFRNLYFDSSNPVLAEPSKCGTQALGIQPSGSDITFEYCEVYFSGLRGSGFVTDGDRLTIRYSKIHDFGSCFNYDHGAYVGDGDGVRIYGNWIWNNPHGWGIQVYPSPSNGRFYANVIDACGSGFVIADEGSPTCTGNDVYNNVITNSVGSTGQGGWRDIGHGISGTGPLGAGNKFRDNCVYNCPGGVGTAPNVEIRGNITANPLFIDAANHDYRLTAGSPAAVKAYGLPDFVVGPTV